MATLVAAIPAAKATASPASQRPAGRAGRVGADDMDLLLAVFVFQERQAAVHRSFQLRAAAMA
jgi:hypothetical protein